MGTDELKGSPPPHVDLKLEADGLRIMWKPRSGRWGVFKEDTEPVEVEISKWHLAVSEKPVAHAAKSKPIPTDPVDGTKTEMKIAKDKLPKKGIVTVQLIGVFKSKDVNGEVFDEGIYAEPVSVEIA